MIAKKAPSPAAILIIIAWGAGTVVATGTLRDPWDSWVSLAVNLLSLTAMTALCLRGHEALLRERRQCDARSAARIAELNELRQEFLRARVWLAYLAIYIGGLDRHCQSCDGHSCPDVG